MRRRITAFFVAILMLIVCFTYSVAAESNAQIIYTFLTDYMGLNSAAACGVLANIERESGFRPDALGDNGTSFGICQWHDVADGQGRYTSLKNFCEGRGLDYTELMSQLYYLEFELTNWYPKVWNALYSVENTPEGAYEAAYYWCYHFEVPANRGEKAVERGNIAKDSYWPVYNEEEPMIGVYEVWVVDVDPTLNVRTGPDTTYPKSASLEMGTEIHVTEISHSGTFLWGKIETGWCVLDYCKYVSGSLFTVNYATECTVKMESQPKATNQELALASSTELVKNGYTFVGWATERGGEIIYPPEGGVYAGNESITLYGVWERNPEVALVAGDVNSDGTFNMKDASRLLRHLASYDDPVDLVAADVNGDGIVSAKDVARMLKKIANYDVEFVEPYEPPETSDTTDTSADSTDTSEDATDTEEPVDTTGTDIAETTGVEEVTDIVTENSDASEKDTLI